MIGKYSLHNKLGDGGYATVFKCTDQIGIRYACKVMPKSKNKRTRVTQEVAIMKTMNFSPKVVRIVDACEDADAFYIIQEWCRGGSVHDYVKNFPNYGENTVASIVRGVLRALIHMHSVGIIHADIKPSNVFLGDLSQDADVKVGDLGTAIISHSKLDSITVDNLVGTPWFMAPENLSSIYHPSSDIWSLGVMTYQLLSGRLPFNDWRYPHSPRITVIWNEVLNKAPTFTRDSWNNIDPVAQEFVATCLNKDYKKRPDAYECLQHPWLLKTDCTDRFKGVPLLCEPLAYDENAMTIILPAS